MTPFEEAEDNKVYVKKKRNTWLYLCAIGVLLLSNVYFFFNSNSNKAPISSVSNEFADTTEAIEKDPNLEILRAEYNSALYRLDALIGKNATLTQLLNDKNSEINKSKNRIHELLVKHNITVLELEEARNLIQKLQNSVTTYEQSIDRLKKENKALSKQKDSLVAHNSGLQEKIDLAKILRVSNIRMKGLQLTRGGKDEKETEKAKRIDVLRIMFDIEENKFTSSGIKELDICIINPNGELLSNDALGSGSFKMSDGKYKYYYTSKEVMLHTEELLSNITVDWQQTSNYEKGVYTVEIYNEGYLIGKGAVSLR
jgi:predicted nuclease with TOPRIM domain